MTAADLERLFWEEFDGPPSAARQGQIEELARQRPETQSRLEELQAMAETLAGAEEVAPPPELRAEVRRQVANRPAYGVGAGGSITGWVRETLASGWQPRLAYATLGLLVGIFATYLVVNGPSPLSEVDRAQLSGALNVDPAAGQVLDEIALADSAGSLLLSRGDGSLVATLTPTTDRALEISFSGGGLAPLTIERIGASRHEMTITPETVRIVTDGSITVVFGVATGSRSTLSVRVSTPAGGTLLERQFAAAELIGSD